jgi:hypothetical protein
MPWGGERWTDGSTPTNFHFTSENMQTLQAGRGSKAGLGYISITHAGLNRSSIKR